MSNILNVNSTNFLPQTPNSNFNLSTVSDKTNLLTREEESINLVSKSVLDLIPPVAKRVPHSNIYHNKSYNDEYHWIRDDSRKNVEMLDLLKAENNYAENFLEPLEALADTMYNEMISRLAEDDISLPVTKGEYQYYTKTVKGLQYPIRCRKHNDGEEEVLLDLNKFKDKQLDLGKFIISNDQIKIAYALDTKGNEKYTIYVKDLVSGTTTSEVVDVASDIVWSGDSSSLYYLSHDSTLRAYRMHKHVLGNSQDKDTLLVQEDDEKYSLSMDRSISEQYLFLHNSKSTASEVYYLNLSSNNAELKLFSKRQEDRLYSLEHHNKDFLVLTNRYDGKKFINFYLLQAAIDHSEDEQGWKEVVPYHHEKFLTEVYGLKDYVLLEERENGYAQIRIVDPKAKNDEGFVIDLPEPIFVSNVATKYLNYSKPELTFSYTSPTTPTSVYYYDITTKQRKLLKTDPVLGGYDSKLYQSERVVADENVPISVVYRKDIFKRDGSNPLHLYGYGSYGLSMEPKFRQSLVSLLDRGFVYAIAHVRGGTDQGRHWYELEGKLLTKQNTFRDFANAAKQLIKLNYTNPTVLSIEGGSAGGLLVGATTNQNPELFNAMIADVPFMDVINTMMDPTIPLTVNEYEEWGDPNISKYFDYMLKYSPYDNLPTNLKAWPHTLVRAGLNDPRVQYWEPAKYVAKLRYLISKNHPTPNKRYQGLPSQLCMLTKLESGHFGASGRYDVIKDLAKDYAFLVATAKQLKPFV